MTYTLQQSSESNCDPAKMSDPNQKCTCSKDGYSPDCPLVFLQGGVVLHPINDEMQLKPRVYSSNVQDSHDIERELKLEPRPLFNNVSSGHTPPSSISSSDDGIVQLPYNAGHAVLPTGKVNQRDPTRPIDDYQLPMRPLITVREQMYNEFEGCNPDTAKQPPVRKDTYGRGNMGTDTQMTEGNRKYLQKFEALEFNGQTITGASIGGFQVDISKAAEKVREIAPLPVSKLPIIFQDGDLNFLHHFFQGLEIMMGREMVMAIASAEKYSDRTELHLLPLITQMIQSGYERSDNEITVFTKKVLISTFEQEANVQGEGGSAVLVVAANLWGFQYIESGMQCKESDLKMWLSICYNHYRTVWFNAFKSAGVPAFALEGVQTRYESTGSSRRYTPMGDDVGVDVTRAYTYDVPRRTRRSKAGSSHGGRRHTSTETDQSNWNRLFGKH